MKKVFSMWVFVCLVSLSTFVDAAEFSEDDYYYDDIDFDEADQSIASGIREIEIGVFRKATEHFRGNPLASVIIQGIQKAIIGGGFERGNNAESVPEPKFPQPVGGVASDGYTGLIVDCSGLHLDTAMSPVIKTANREIYGYKNIDYDMVINDGMVSYSSNLTDNVSRAGANPLIIKALDVEGIGSNCNPVISDSDADKILSANKVSHFLEHCAVVFVK